MIGRQWARCCGRMERVLVKSEDWMPDTWVSYLLILSGAGAGASAVDGSTRSLNKIVV